MSGGGDAPIAAAKRAGCALSAVRLAIAAAAAYAFVVWLIAAGPKASGWVSVLLAIEGLVLAGAALVMFIGSIEAKAGYGGQGTEAVKIVGAVVEAVSGVPGAELLADDASSRPTGGWRPVDVQLGLRHARLGALLFVLTTGALVAQIAVWGTSLSPGLRAIVGGFLALPSVTVWGLTASAERRFIGVYGNLVAKRKLAKVEQALEREAKRAKRRAK